MNTLQDIQEFFNQFNQEHGENYATDSIRIDFNKQYKLKPLKALGNWHKIDKNNQSILAKLKKRLTDNEITSVYRLEKYNIYYYNKSDKERKKYRNAQMVIFGIRQYHKNPPPKELINTIVSILKNVSAIDVCVDLPYKPNLNTLEEIYELKPYITNKGTIGDTHYINTPDITMIDKIVIYNKQLKNNLDFTVWRVEATISIPNVKMLHLPLHELKINIIDHIRR